MGIYICRSEKSLCLSHSCICFIGTPFVRSSEAQLCGKYDSRLCDFQPLKQKILKQHIFLYGFALRHKGLSCFHQHLFRFLFIALDRQSCRQLFRFSFSRSIGIAQNHIKIALLLLRMSFYHKYNLLCVAPTSAVDNIHCSNLSQRIRMCKFFNFPHFAELTSKKKEDGLSVLCTLCPPSSVLFYFHGVIDNLFLC